MKRKFKTTVLHLLSGKRVRIKKADVVAVHEQAVIGGGVLTWAFL